MRVAFFTDMRGQYIDFISSYCDRWCERCPFTDRCSAHAVEIAMQMCGDFTEAVELAVGAPPPRTEKEARRRQQFAEEIASIPEPTPDEMKAYQREHDEREERIEETAVTTASERVLLLSRRWLDDYAEGLSRDAKGPLAEALEIASWDSFFIAVKLHRALSGADEERPRGRRGRLPTQTDWNGSAKVALISIIRSATAWDVIADATGDPDAAQVARELRDLQHEVEKTFPQAWKFQRPGFDGVVPKRRWRL